MTSTMKLHVRRLLAGISISGLALLTLVPPSVASAAPEDGLQLGADTSGTAVRTFNWKLAKQADHTTKQVASPSATTGFTWTVTATPNGSADSDWYLSGQTRFVNGGPDRVDADLSVTYGATNCWVPIPSINLDPGLEIPVPFVCDVAALPDYHTPVVLTVGSRSWNLPVSWSFSEVGATVTVTDDHGNPGASPATLGTAVWDEAGSPTVFHYNQTLDGPASWAGSVNYTNTAALLDGAVKAQSTVTITTPSEPISTPTASPTVRPTSSPTVTPTVAPTTAPTRGEKDASGGTGELASTGSEVGEAALLASLLLVGSGVIALVGSRPRGRVGRRR